MTGGLATLVLSVNKTINKTTVMSRSHPLTNVFVFLFKAADIKKLADDNPDYVLITCALETRRLDGHSVAVVKVRGDSCMKGKMTSVNPTGVKTTVAGCPVPPCIPGGGLGSDECEQEIEELLEFSISLL